MWAGATQFHCGQTARLMSLVANLAGNRTKPSDFMPQTDGTDDSRVSAAEFQILAQRATL
jgi:hypothetical protein